MDKLLVYNAFAPSHLPCNHHHVTRAAQAAHKRAGNVIAYYKNLRIGGNHTSDVLSEQPRVAICFDQLRYFRHCVLALEQDHFAISGSQIASLTDTDFVNNARCAVNNARCA